LAVWQGSRLLVQPRPCLFADFGWLALRKHLAHGYVGRKRESLPYHSSPIYSRPILGLSFYPFPLLLCYRGPLFLLHSRSRVQISLFFNIQLSGRQAHPRFSLCVRKMWRSAAAQRLALLLLAVAADAERSVRCVPPRCGW